MKSRSVAWVKGDEFFGIEYADVLLESDSLRAAGVAIGTDPITYRLDYELETASRFVTSRLRVAARGEGWKRSLDLRRTDDADWGASTSLEGDSSLPPPGGDVRSLEGALDCDLALSPLTNTMPVLRHGFLLRDGSKDFLMAWVSVPDLGIHASRQRYVGLERKPGGICLVRYESRDGTFTADLTFDADGLVIDYPALARRLPLSGRE